MTWFGADPGGVDAFGLALLHDDGTYETATRSCVDEAIEWFDGYSGEVLAAGIDAPLWWSSGRSGDRMADQWLRAHYKMSGGAVQTVNSLRGAALLQGAMLALQLRGNKRNLAITEAHPKALLRAEWPKAGKDGPTWAEVAGRFGLDGIALSEEVRQHERDALLAAVAAREVAAVVGCAI